MYRCLLTYLWQVCLPFLLPAQISEEHPVPSPALPEDWNVAENAVGPSADPADGWDLAEVYQELSGSMPEPDLNALTAANAHRYGEWLDVYQQAALAEHIRLNGPLVSIYELQAVPGFDSLTIRRLLPHAKVRPPGGIFHSGAGGAPEQGKRHQLALRWGRVLGPADTSFAGRPDRLSVRFRWQGDHGMRAQLSMEKDPGEQLVSGRSKSGFDHVGAYVQVRRTQGLLRSLVLGNYLVAFGQGLVAYQGFAPGKRLGVSQVRRVASGILPHAPMAESGYLRGCAVELAPMKSAAVRIFYAFRRQDGQVVRDSGQSYFRNFSMTGLHRTPTERASAATIPHHTVGFSAEVVRGRGKVGAHGIADRLGVDRISSGQPYRRFAMAGKRLLNLGVDYGWRYRNLMLFGEVAVSRPGGCAQVHGLVIAADRKLDISILYRRYERNYLALHANALSENGETGNETGFYLGMDLHARRHWQVQAYVDLYIFPWLRYRVGRPEAGQEGVLRLAYSKRKGFGSAWLVRHRLVPQDQGPAVGLRKTPLPRQVHDLLLRSSMEAPLGGGLTLRGRADLRRRSLPETVGEWGYQLSADLLFRSLDKPYSFGIHYAVFHTKSYDVRIYAFERGLQGQFSFPALYGQGHRWSLHTTYRLGGKWQLEVWFARQMNFGPVPGVAETPFLTDGYAPRHELRGQCKWLF